MLFYERDGIDMKAYLPKFREPSTSSAESANSDNTSSSVLATNGANGGGGSKGLISSTQNTSNGQLITAARDVDDQEEGSKKCSLM